MFTSLRKLFSRAISALHLSRQRAPKIGAAEAAQADQKLVFSLSRSRIPTLRQMRYLDRILRPNELNWVRTLGTIAALAIIVLAISYTGRHITTTPKRGGTLTEALVGVPQFVNPLLAVANSVDNELSALTFRGLMKVDADLQVVPDLVDHLDISPDGKTYTVVLKSGLRWSDGEPLTAADVVYTYNTVADPDYNSPLLALYSGLTVESTDDFTVTFQLSEPLAPFPSYLTLGLLPEHVWSASTPAAFPLDELNSKPIGSGPYKFQSLTKDRDGNIRGYSFTRNPYYHGPAPYIDKLVMKFYPDHEQAIEALTSHAVDSYGGVPLDHLTRVDKKFTITPSALSQLTALFFNQKSNGALKTKEVRQALALAIDRQSIIDQVLKGYGRLIDGPILPGYLGYNPGLKRYPYDLAQAEKLLDDNGWKRNDQGIRQKGSQQLTMTLSTVSDPVYLQVAERVVQDWSKIGAQVELKKFDGGKFQKEVIRPRQYEALLFGQRYSHDTDPYPYWHSSQQRETGFSLAIFVNRNVDQDVLDGRRSTDQAKQIKDYLDFQNIVAAEVPAIFLYQPEYLYAHQSSLRGFAGDRLVSSEQRQANMESWYLQTKLRWGKK